MANKYIIEIITHHSCSIRILDFQNNNTEIYILASC